MKISLPNILRTALIAAFAQFVPIITIATASLVAISAQAQADIVEKPYKLGTINTKADAKLTDISYTDLVMDLNVPGDKQSHLYATGDAQGVLKCEANIEVKEWKINNGSGGRTYNFSGVITSSTSVSESGDINYTWTGQNTYNFSGDMSGFAGDINVSGSGALDLIFSGTARDNLSGTGSILSEGSGSITYNTIGTSSVTNTKIEVDGGVRLTFEGDGSTYNVSSHIEAGALEVGANTLVNFTGLVDQFTEGGASLTVLAGGVANFTHESTTDRADLEVGFLHGEGTVNVRNLKILRNTSSDIQINASGTVSSVASITASSLTATISLTLTGANTSSSIAGNATTGALTLSNSSALNVAGILTTTSITVDGSTGASITTPLISAGSIAATSLTITLTEAALASMNFDVDGKFTLIDLDTAYTGAYIFDIENVSALTAEFAYDELFWVGNNSYTISKNTVEGEHIIITEVDRIPEPSTATLSLLALAGLLARRRRKQA